MSEPTVSLAELKRQLDETNKQWQAKFDEQQKSFASERLTTASKIKDLEQVVSVVPVVDGEIDFKSLCDRIGMEKATRVWADLRAKGESGRLQLGLAKQASPTLAPRSAPDSPSEGK